MAKRMCAGIVWTSTQVTAAVVESVGEKNPLRATLSVPLGETSPEATFVPRPALERLAGEVRAACGKMPAAVLALPAHLYFSLTHHAEFSDFGRINATLRYDVEDSYSFEAEKAAFCFNILNVTDKGSDLLVHAVQRNHLEPLLEDMYQAGLDALAVVPDLVAWREYLVQTLLPQREEPLLVLASHEKMVYVLTLDQSGAMRVGRTLLAGASENPAAILENELPRMLSVLPPEHQPRRLFYVGEGLPATDMNHLAKTLALTATPLASVNWAEAVAAGAAMAWLRDGDLADFRADRLPPKSLTQGQSKALLALAGAAALLFLALALWFNIHAAVCNKQVNKDVVQMREKWKEVSSDKNAHRHSASLLAQKFSNLRKTILNESDKRGDKKSQQAAAACLTSMLANVNRLPDKFDLRIDSLRISGKNIFFSGSVPTLEDCDKLQALFSDAQSGLIVDSISFKTSTGDKTSGSRRSFDMRLVLKTTDERETKRK